MATGIRKHRLFERERDLLDFSRAYLSEAFPNPERKGCPPDNALRALATYPTRSDKSISNHLTCCSPCFNAYVGHLARAKAEEFHPLRIRRARWISRSLVTGSAVVVLVVGIYGFFIRAHKLLIVAPKVGTSASRPASHGRPPAAAINFRVLIDLTNASPVRGAERRPSGTSPQVVPSYPFIDLDLLLPLGSEERQYSVRLASSRTEVWSGSAKARLENGQMVLQMHANFGLVPPGKYDLVVVSKGLRLTVPVLVKRTLPEGN